MKKTFKKIFRETLECLLVGTFFGLTSLPAVESTIYRITKPKEIICKVKNEPQEQNKLRNSKVAPVEIIVENSETVDRSVDREIPTSTPEIKNQKDKYKTRQKKQKPLYSNRDLLETQKILYAEAANQSRIDRRLVGKAILNRARDSRFPSTPYKVIHQRNAFSCTFDRNKNWKQVNGKKEMNDYEKMVYKKCKEDGKFVFNGEKIGIPREDEIIAYHDKSVDIKDLREKDSFWKKVEPVYSGNKLIFYAFRKQK